MDDPHKVEIGRYVQVDDKGDDAQKKSDDRLHAERLLLFNGSYKHI